MGIGLDVAQDVAIGVTLLIPVPVEDWDTTEVADDGEEKLLSAVEVDENVSINEEIEVFDWNGVSVAVEIELKDWRAECETRALAVTELDESGDRVLEAELVPLKDEAEDFEADVERDGMVVTDVEREIILLIVLLAVIDELKLVREETDGESDWSAFLELYDDRVAIALTDDEYDPRCDIERTVVIVESILLV